MVATFNNGSASSFSNNRINSFTSAVIGILMYALIFRSKTMDASLATEDEH